MIKGNKTVLDYLSHFKLIKIFEWCRYQRNVSFMILSQLIIFLESTESYLYFLIVHLKSSYVRT